MVYEKPQQRRIKWLVFIEQDDHGDDLAFCGGREDGVLADDRKTEGGEEMGNRGVGRSKQTHQ